MTGKERKARCLAEMAGIAGRFKTGRDFLDDANKWHGHDGRTAREARGSVTLKGEVRSKDRPIADAAGNEFHVRRNVRIVDGQVKRKVPHKGRAGVKVYNGQGHVAAAMRHAETLNI